MQKEIHIVLGLCALFVWSILSLLLISGQPATTVLIMDVILCFLFSLLLYISSKIRRICIVLLLMASFFQSIVCILQSFDVLVSKHSLFDVTGFMGNPGLLGGFQAVSAVVILCLLLKTESVGAKTFLSFLLVIVSISLVLSDSRAAFVGFGVGVITVFLNPILDFLKHKKWLILICIISVIVILIALYLYRPNSANARLLIWRVTLDMIYDAPIFGHGMSMFSYKYMGYQAAYFNSHPENVLGYLADNVAYPYNDFLRIAVELGLFGIFIVGFLIYRILSIGTDVASKGPLLTWIIFAMFSYPSYDRIMMFCLPVVFFLPFTIHDSVFRNENRLQYLFVAVILFIFILREYRFNNIEDRLHESIATENELGLDDIQDWYLVPRFNALLSVLCESDVSRVFSYGKYLRPTCENNCVVGDYYMCHKKDVKLAEKYYNEAMHMIPTRMTPLYKLWKLSVSENRYVEAELMAKRIMNLELKTEGTRTIRMKNEVKRCIYESD